MNKEEKEFRVISDETAKYISESVSTEKSVEVEIFNLDGVFVGVSHQPRPLLYVYLVNPVRQTELDRNITTTREVKDNLSNQSSRMSSLVLDLRDIVCKLCTHSDIKLLHVKKVEDDVGGSYYATFLDLNNQNIN